MSDTAIIVNIKLPTRRRHAFWFLPSCVFATAARPVVMSIFTSDMPIHLDRKPGEKTTTPTNTPLPLTLHLSPKHTLYNTYILPTLCITIKQPPPLSDHALTTAGTNS